MKQSITIVLLMCLGLSGRVGTLHAEKTLLRETDVFVAKTGGYHTYRIPAVVVTKKGTLLAFCEGRKTGRGDHGDLDLVIRRSSDSGATWKKMQVVHEEGGAAKITIGNAAPVVDQKTGTIWLPFCRNNDGVFITHSDDDGLTWTKPREITDSVKRPGWGWYATGPGHGVQLRSGRLLIPCDHREKIDGKWIKHSHVFFSDDHGKSWKLGGTVGPNTDECQALELADGNLYINMRSYAGKNRRASAISQDGGESWQPLRLEEKLIEPVCQGSVVRLSGGVGGGKNRILFSNPASLRREKLTVRISYDEGKTWSDGKVLCVGSAAYSDLCVLPDGTIGCLYERDGSGRIVLARFNLAWLTDGKEGLSGK